MFTTHFPNVSIWLIGVEEKATQLIGIINISSLINNGDGQANNASVNAVNGLFQTVCLPCHLLVLFMGKGQILERTTGSTFDECYLEHRVICVPVLKVFQCIIFTGLLSADPRFTYIPNNECVGTSIGILNQ